MYSVQRWFTLSKDASKLCVFLGIQWFRWLITNHLHVLLVSVLVAGADIKPVLQRKCMILTSLKSGTFSGLFYLSCWQLACRGDLGLTRKDCQLLKLFQCTWQAVMCGLLLSLYPLASCSRFFTPSRDWKCNRKQKRMQHHLSLLVERSKVTEIRRRCCLDRKADVWVGND